MTEVTVLLQWGVASLCLLIFGLIALLNAWTLIEYRLNKKHVSAVPLVGGLLGVFGLLLLPVGGPKEFWWLPLLLDYGSVPMLTYFFLYHLWRLKDPRE
jgi:hypothetical protein